MESGKAPRVPSFGLTKAFNRIKPEYNENQLLQKKGTPEVCPGFCQESFSNACFKSAIISSTSQCPQTSGSCSALRRILSAAARLTGGGWCWRDGARSTAVRHMDHNRRQLQSLHQLGGGFSAALHAKGNDAAGAFGIYFCASW